jgi:hypothetical protein
VWGRRSRPGHDLKRRLQDALDGQNDGRDPAVVARAWAALRVAGYDDAAFDTMLDMLITVQSAVTALRAGAVR